METSKTSDFLHTTSTTKISQSDFIPLAQAHKRRQNIATTHFSVTLLICAMGESQLYALMQFKEMLP